MAKEKAVKAELTNDIRSFKVTAKLLSPMLGTAPNSADIYVNFLIEKALAGELANAKSAEDKERVKELKQKMVDHELSTLPSTDDPDLVKGKTVFRRVDGNGAPFLPGYMIRGFYKSAVEAHTDLASPSSRVDKFVYIGENQVVIQRDGVPLVNVDSEFTRPLRVLDQRTQVSRTCLATSEVINPIGNTTIEFTVFVLAKGFSQGYSGGKFKVEDFERITALGLAFNGLGQYRSGGHGAFEVTSFKEETVDWKTALAARQQMLKEGQQIYGGSPPKQESE